MTERCREIWMLEAECRWQQGTSVATLEKLRRERSKCRIKREARNILATQGLREGRKEGIR